MTSYNIVNPTNLVQGMPENIADVVANFQAIQGVVNGNLDDGNIKAAAAISISKLASYPADATRYLRGDGTWAVISVSALPADTVVAAATRIVSNITTAGDTQPAWRVLGSGRMDWGPGGATAPDTNLYRSAATVLKTDGYLLATLGVETQGSATGNEAFGARLTTDTVLRYQVNLDGRINWGPGNAAIDTNLYRAYANGLRTDGEFLVGSYLWLMGGASAIIARNMSGAGQATLAQRLAADTQDRFELFADGKMYWGSGSAAVDTNLYRAAAGLLTTDTSMRVNQQLQVGVGANLAISANAITITASYHALTGTGPLKTINGVVSGSGVSLLVLRNGTGAALVIDSTGNIYATGGAGSIVLPNNETVALYYDANSSVWRVLHVSTAPAIQLIQTITLASDGPISFQNIPAVYSHLEIRGMVRSALAATVDTPWIRFNNDTATNYSTQQIGANSATPYANQIAGLGAAYPQANVIDANSQSAGIFTPVVLHIPGYASTTWHKMFYVMH